MFNSILSAIRSAVSTTLAKPSYDAWGDEQDEFYSVMASFNENLKIDRKYSAFVTIVAQDGSFALAGFSEDGFKTCAKVVITGEHIETNISWDRFEEIAALYTFTRQADQICDALTWEEAAQAVQDEEDYYFEQEALRLQA